MDKENANDKTADAPAKPKSNRNRIIVGIVGVALLFCLGLLAFGVYLNSTPEGQATATVRAQERQETRVERTAVAASQATEEARPTDTPLPTDTPVPTNTPAPTSTPMPTDTPAPTATPDPNLIRPGTYIVGTDIQPGIYRGEAGSGVFESCYWARLEDLSGEFDALLANDNSIGQFYVEIQDSDYAFETACELVKLSSLPEPSGEFPQTITPGTYLVGRDIQAGTYRGEAGTDIEESCYWARLSNVSGGFNALIANDNSTGQFFIQVQESDFALSTACELELIED